MASTLTERAQQQGTASKLYLVKYLSTDNRRCEEQEFRDFYEALAFWTQHGAERAAIYKQVQPR